MGALEGGISLITSLHKIGLLFRSLLAEPCEISRATSATASTFNLQTVLVSRDG